MGTFENPPMENFHTSPFLTRDKSSSSKRRVIVDLSWQKGETVSNGIQPETYLGTEFVLTYPTIDHVTDQVVRAGKNCHIFKIDIKKSI